MSFKLLRNAFVAAATLTAVAIGPANAQVQSPGWFGSVTGWYVVDGLNDWKAFREASQTGVGDGYGGRAYLGYRFMGSWDIAVGGEYINTSRGNRDKVDFADLHHRMSKIDGELGYTFAMNGVGVRAFAGVRYIDARFYYRDTGTSASDVDSWGIGPRIGVDATYRFAGTSWSIFGGLSGAVVFGDIQEKALRNWTCDDCGKQSRTAVDATGQIGVGYEIAPLLMLAVGYRVDANWGSNYRIHDSTGQGDPLGSGRTVTHGPFARVSYNIGAPASAPMPMAAPVQGPVTTNTYIIFFDWDRSVLTPQAKDTVKTASDAFKTKGSARVTLTGHADRSGADAYNMALSLRRGAATKDELVRNGVPANAIVIIGKGESAPLVPTADGVREPQNRRVEIVLQ